MFSFLDISWHAYKEMINALLYASTGIFSISLVRMKFFQKFTSKRWLKKENNTRLLETEKFLDSVVDKETMKYFIQNYGKEHFISLMKGKENLKYKDIFFYINENSETANLSKVAECLLKN